MSALRILASDAANNVYQALAATTRADDIDDNVRQLWRCYGEGSISEDDAAFLADFAERRRPPRHTAIAPAIGGHAVSTTARRISSRFKPRQRKRCPNRLASRERRRTLGGSSTLPPDLRCHYTEGQRAVLAIIAGEVKHHGICDLPNDKIGALAGVCRTTVQTTLHLAKIERHVRITERPQPGQKHLPNVVTIISMEWNSWLKRGPAAHRPIGSNEMKKVSTTKNLFTDASGGAENKIRLPSALACQLATEVTQIAGHSPEQPPQSWVNSRPEQTVQRWIDELVPIGLKPEQVIRGTAVHVMRRKPERLPPFSMNYFTPTIAQIVEGNRRACAELSTTIAPRAAR